MTTTNALLTVSEVQEAVKASFAKAGLQSVSVVIVAGEIVHNGKIKPYTICGEYTVVKPDGFGGLDRFGTGECIYNKERNIVEDSTSSTQTSRRYSKVTEVVFSVKNINSISRAHGLDPKEEVDVYAEFATDDVLWSKQ